MPNSELRRGHDHPMEGPVVVVHSQQIITHTGLLETPMHAFGPFADEDEARRWHEEVPIDFRDTCHKLIIDLIPPVDL